MNRGERVQDEASLLLMLLTNTSITPTCSILGNVGFFGEISLIVDVSNCGHIFQTHSVLYTVARVLLCSLDDKSRPYYAVNKVKNNMISIKGYYEKCITMNFT